MASKGFHTDALPAHAAVAMRFAIVRTEWNSGITERLTRSAKQTLQEHGASSDAIVEEVVPGAFELVYACQRIAESQCYDAVIAIGCVIRGGTPHFDYICQAVTQGITQLNTTGRVPIIFGVLTVNDFEQAIARCGGAEGDKGSEFALTAIKMARFASRFNS